MMMATAMLILQVEFAGVATLTGRCLPDKRIGMRTVNR
jgi:hypothetical protein